MLTGPACTALQLLRGTVTDWAVTVLAALTWVLCKARVNKAATAYRSASFKSIGAALHPAYVLMQVLQLPASCAILPCKTTACMSPWQCNKLQAHSLTADHVRYEESRKRHAVIRRGSGTGHHSMVLAAATWDVSDNQTELRLRRRLTD